MNKWKIGYYVATYILALIAILGFIFSIIMSKDTSTIMRNIQQELESSNVPIITINRHGWYKEEGEITCDNPPTGIYLECCNISNVPIQVYEIKMRFSYDGEDCPDPVSKLGEASSYILAPGEKFKHGVIRKEFFQKYLKNKKGNGIPPFIRSKSEIVFSRLNFTERYIYKATKEVGFDCTNYKSSQMYPLNEQISRVTK